MTLLLPIAVLLWGLSVVLAPDDPALLTIAIESQVTSERIPGASVMVGTVRYASDADGEIRILPVPSGTNVVASANGHEAMEKPVPEDGRGEMTLSLTGVLVVGSVRDAVSDTPVEGAEVQVTDSNGNQVAATRTDTAGGFIFKFTPEDSQLVIRDEIYGEKQQPIGQQRRLIVLLDPPAVHGRVVDDQGRPVPGAEVSSPGVSAVADTDGRFVLDGVGQGSELTVRSSTAGSTTLDVEGTDLGDIILTGERDGSPATPEGGAG